MSILHSSGGLCQTLSHFIPPTPPSQPSAHSLWWQSLFLTPLVTSGVPCREDSYTIFGNTMCSVKVKYSFWTWWNKRHYHGSPHPPQKSPKAQHQEPQRQDIYLRLLVKLRRFLSRQTNFTFNQAVLKSCSGVPATGLPLSLSWMIWRWNLLTSMANLCGCKEYSQECVCPADAQTESVCTSYEQPCLDPHPQGWGHDPQLGPSGLDSAMDSAMDCGPHKGQRCTGPRNPSQPHQALCILQMSQLQKPTAGLTLLLKRFWLLKKNKVKIMLSSSRRRRRRSKTVIELLNFPICPY